MTLVVTNEVAEWCDGLVLLAGAPPRSTISRITFALPRDYLDWTALRKAAESDHSY